MLSRDSRGGQMARGRWRVRYPDGNTTHPFTLDYAVSYARMFDGAVEPYPGRENWLTRLMWRLWVRDEYGAEWARLEAEDQTHDR